MLVSERVPLDEIMGLASELTTESVIVEYVGPGDPMFRKLLRGRDALHESFNRQVFETALTRRFRIVAECPLDGMDRKLYWVKRGN